MLELHSEVYFHFIDQGHEPVEYNLKLNQPLNFILYKSGKLFSRLSLHTSQEAHQARANLSTGCKESQFNSSLFWQTLANLCQPKSHFN